MFGKRVFQMIGLLTIVSAMIACAPNPYSDVTTLLGSKGPAAKERAASRLAGMKGDIYVDALVKALYDPSQRVIIAAADALGEKGNTIAERHVCRDESGGAESAEAICRFDQKNACTLLRRRNGSGNTRGSAACYKHVNAMADRNSAAERQRPATRFG